MSSEAWRDIPGFEGRYQASDHGRIRSLTGSFQQRTRSGILKSYNREGRVLRFGSKLYGYLNVCLGGKKTYNVGPLICSAFHGPCPDGMECAHLNGDCRDNRPANLTWATKLENAAHKRQHGTLCKLNDDTVRQIYIRRRAGEKAKSLATEFGVHPETVFKIGNRRHRPEITRDL